MVYAFLCMAVALGAIAYRCRGGIRIFFIVCCLLNIAAAGKAVITDDPYTFRLRPNHGATESADWF